jgi:excisionase family DNA binding protein
MSSRTARTLTTAEAGRELGVGDHVVGRLARQGHLELQRFGRYYMVREDDLPAVRRVLAEHGFLEHEGDHGEE